MPSLIRQLLFGVEETSRETWIEPDGVTTGKIVGYFDRVTDKQQTRNAIVKRYGSGIRQVRNEEGKIVLETYERDGFAEAVDAGHIEALNIGFGHNIVNALASLFSEDTQKWQLIPPSEGTGVTVASEYIGEYREQGGLSRVLIEADKRSIQIGCSVLLLEFYEGGIKYTSIDPGKVKVRYDGSVESNGTTRPTNFRDIEDATCVIIETGTVDAQYKTYLAIYGRSQTYPVGRYVTYQANDGGRDVPEPMTAGTFDYLINGNLANPLSYYAEMNPDLGTPEYPVCIFYGGHTSTDQLLPVSTSLLEESLEADVATSHLRATSADAARGTNVIERSDTARGQPLPRTMVGNIALMPGQSFKHESHDAGASVSSWEVLKEQLTQTAQSYGVPDYMVSSEDHTLDASTGIALEIKTRPLIKIRQQREALNRPAVCNLFEIERVLLNMFAEGDNSVISLLNSCSFQWDPGEIQLPRDEQQHMSTVTTLLDRGIYDTLEAIRDVYRLPTESDAIDKYEQLKKRGEKYPPLKEEEKEEPPKSRLALRRKQGQQQQ